MNKFNLKDISEVRVGITQRSYPDKGNLKQFVLIQPRNIKYNEIIGDINSIDLDPTLAKNHLLRKDDILIVNKGNNFATYLCKENCANYLASSSFFIIRPNVSKCLPSYLQWFLQQFETREYLSRSLVTSTVPSLNKSALDSLSVPLPPIKQQIEIVDFLDEINLQKKLLQSIMQTTEDYGDSYIWSLITAQK